MNLALLLNFIQNYSHIAIMGLLSNPSNKQLSPILIKFVGKQNLLSVLAYFASIIWLVCLSSRQYNSGKSDIIMSLY